MSSSITNTGDNTLSSNLKSILPNCDKVDALVGYFYFSGFRDLHNELKDKQIRILVGMDIDKKIIDKVSTLKDLNLDSYTTDTKTSSRSIAKDDYIENFSRIFNDTDFFDNAEKYLNPETTFESDTELHQVHYEPIGVEAIIIPWNFPFANFVWATFQSLLAGNTIVLKHSEECPLCGKFIEEVFTKHLPAGVFNEIYGAGEVGGYLLEQDVQMVSFTGSTKTGKHIYEIAGKKFIKAVMELGGSAPGIVFGDADIDAAVSNIVTMRLYNQGQCCDGLKRLIVHESVFDEVVQKLAHAFSEKKVGSAENKDSNIGPLVAKRQVELLVEQFDDAVSKGAKVVVGGKSIEGGAYFEPTILTGITKDMRVWSEEVFGPILPVVSFSTTEEAIALGNETAYGLGSYVYTGDKVLADRMASALEAGMVSVNSTNYGLPQDPFGGYKNSGHGRQHGKYGFAEVTQVKIVAKNK